MDELNSEIEIDRDVELSKELVATKSYLSINSDESDNNSSDNDDSLKSNSSCSLSDTMLKVRRLTQVYDESEEVLLSQLQNLQNKMLPNTSEFNDDDNVSIATAPTELEQPLTTVKRLSQDKAISETDLLEAVNTNRHQPKLGDKSYKLPTKAAAILGADDSSINHVLIPLSVNKTQHALFLENKQQQVKVKKTSTCSDSSDLSKQRKRIGIDKIVSLLKPTGEAINPSDTNSSGGVAPSNVSAMTQLGSGGVGGVAAASSSLQIKELEKLIRSGKVSAEQIRGWSKSFETLLHDKFGLALFHDFLRSEFSDENIEFWIACEEYRTITNQKKLAQRAEKIYNDFVGVQAAREVNLDSRTRQQTELDIQLANNTTFDTAQKRIQALMEKDSYQRFLRSEFYCRMQRLVNTLHPTPTTSSSQLHISSPSASALSQHHNTASVNIKGPAISTLGITAQDLSKLTMTTSKLALIPSHTSTSVANKQQPTSYKLAATNSGVVHPDDSSLPYTQNSLLYSPPDKKK